MKGIPEEEESGEINGGGKGTTKNNNDGGSLTRKILALALPALVSLCVDPLMSAVDTAYIGRLGSDLGGGEVRVARARYVFCFFSLFNSNGLSDAEKGAVYAGIYFSLWVVEEY